MRIHFNATSNTINIPEIRKQTEDNLRKRFEESMPEIIKRMGERPPFITHEVGVYSNLFDEAENCYAQGFYYATISMIGIATERFCMELGEKIKFKINENEVNVNAIFENKLRQSKRLNLLKSGRLINEETFNRLNQIKKIRDKYIHPLELGYPKEDSLKILKLFVDILNSRFSDIYVILDGKIVEKSLK